MISLVRNVFWSAKETVYNKIWIKKYNALYFYANTDCIGLHHSNLLHTSFLGPENYLYDQKDIRATTNSISVGGKTKLIIMFLFPE